MDLASLQRRGSVRDVEITPIQDGYAIVHTVMTESTPTRRKGAVATEIMLQRTLTTTTRMYFAGSLAAVDRYLTKRSL